ncbi:hypothetical protein BJ912DRAFT_995891 [Pholiota molesta]|nr:hypothetical protein BJ912DRAFT_995891 [Pholiota molesta]
MIRGALWPSLILLVLVSLPMEFEAITADRPQFPLGSLATHVLPRHGHSDTSLAFRIPSSWCRSIAIMCEQVAAHSRYVTLEIRALCLWCCDWSGHGEATTSRACTVAIIAADSYLSRSMLCASISAGKRALQSVRLVQMEK